MSNSASDNGQDLCDQLVEIPADEDVAVRNISSRKPIFIQIKDIERVLQYWTDGKGKNKSEAAERISKLKKDIESLRDKQAVIDETRKSTRAHGYRGAKRRYGRSHSNYRQRSDS